MTAPDALGALARALLYEGFALYPYRASSLKNRARWFFGGVWPPAWAVASPGDADALSAEALLEGDGATRVAAELRFLQPLPGTPPERRVALADASLAGLAQRTRRARFAFAPALRGELALSARALDPGAFRVTASVLNLSPLEPADRDAALGAAMASVHVVLRAQAGAWVSLQDPPPARAAAAAGCARHGLYPVLAGAAGARDTLLLSPIALADYPQVAPESPADLFDATEIDELLALRVMTLADAERAELERADPRVRALLRRVESLGPGGLAALHGARRAPRSGAALAPGARVRLHPRRGADVMDLALEGRAATVTAVERDFDGGTHVAVVLDDDPGADLGQAGFHGHRFFFTPAEVEPL